MSKTALAKVDPVAKRDKLLLELAGRGKKQAIDIYDTWCRFEEVLLTGSTSTDGVWKFWVNCWEHAMQTGYTQPVPRGKAVVRRLLRTLPANVVQLSMVNYFTHCDEWTKRHGYPIDSFASQIHSFRGPQRDGVAEELAGKGLFSDDKA